MNTQQLESELQALRELNIFLVRGFCDKVTIAKDKMKSYIINISQSGVPFELCQKFVTEHYRQDEDNFSKLFRHVSNEDLSTINHFANMILRELESSTGRGHEPFSLIYPEQTLGGSHNAEVRNNSVQDKEIQCTAVCDFMDFVTDLVNDLEQSCEDYKRCLQIMRDRGVPRQMMDVYENNNAKEDLIRVGSINVHLTTDWYIFERVFNTIAENLEKLGIHSYRTPKKTLKF